MSLLSYIRFAGDGTVRKHAPDRKRWLFVVSIAFVLTRPVYGEILQTEINPANGHTYHLLDLALDDPDALNTWEEMEEEAISMGGHLVTLNDAEEEEWIDDTFLPTISNAFFIGLNDLDEEGTFVWTSGEPASI